MNGAKMKKLICFDLDGTLTQHRSPLEQKNRDFLDRLREKYEVILVGAGDAKRIYTQTGQYPVPIIGNYGMQESKIENGEFVLFREDTATIDREFFLEQTDYLRKKYGYTEYRGEPVEFHPSGMVTFPLLGTKADIRDKLAFDPTREKRRVLYPEVLSVFKDFSVYIGGSSSFDFSPKRYNKYDAVLRYAAEHGYREEEILFVGDDFGDGGGDSHIRLYGMDYVEVTDYRFAEETVKKAYPALI